MLQGTAEGQVHTQSVQHPVADICEFERRGVGEQAQGSHNVAQQVRGALWQSGGCWNLAALQCGGSSHQSRFKGTPVCGASEPASLVLMCMAAAQCVSRYGVAQLQHSRHQV